MEQKIGKYFGDDPVYDNVDFERIFRMPMDVFGHIYEAFQVSPFFIRQIKGLGILDVHTLQHITAALRMMAYGVAADVVIEKKRGYSRATLLVARL